MVATAGHDVARRQRAEIDADRFLAIRDPVLQSSVLLHLRDQLLAPARDGPCADLDLVVTDWQGRMPKEIRRICSELIHRQGTPESSLRLTRLDLHGKVSWFVAFLQSQRDVFEAGDSPLQSLELSLVDEEGGMSCVDSIPRFRNLTTLRVYQPEFGGPGAITELLRHNLGQLKEFACVSQSSATPFLAALRELDLPAPLHGDPPPLAVLAAARCAETGITALSLEDHGYPPLSVSTVARAENSLAGQRTLLWLRGPEAPMREALATLGTAVARNHVLPQREKSFLGRLGTLKLDLTGMPEAGVNSFRSYAAFKVRDELLSADVELGLRLQVKVRWAHPASLRALLCALLCALPCALPCALLCALPCALLCALLRTFCIAVTQ